MINYDIGTVKNFTFRDLEPLTNYTFDIFADEYYNKTLRGNRKLSTTRLATTLPMGKQ